MQYYSTIQGDTWDLIAFKLFPKLGRELITSQLIQLNTQFIHTVIFPAGCKISLPTIYPTTPKSLPPWLS